MARTRYGTLASAPLNLAQLRQNRGISLDFIADTTKISKRFLLAIEAEKFEELPGGIFSTSYIRQYADAAGYDESALLDRYRSKMGLDPELVSADEKAAGRRGGLLRLQRSPVL